MARQRGLTLIEMLIALVVLSAVMSLSAQAFRFYIEQNQNGTTRLNSDFKQMRQLLAVQDQLAAAFHYFIPGPAEQQFLLFDGKADAVYWVATTSFQDSTQGALSWLGEQEGQLVYCELLLSQRLIIDIPEHPEICAAYQQSLIEVEQIAMQYYGWSSTVERLELGKGQVLTAEQQWSDAYAGTATGVLPDTVRIRYQQAGATQELLVQLRSLDVSRVSNALSN